MMPNPKRIELDMKEIEDLLAEAREALNEESYGKLTMRPDRSSFNDNPANLWVGVTSFP